MFGVLSVASLGCLACAIPKGSEKHPNDRALKRPSKCVCFCDEKHFGNAEKTPKNIPKLKLLGVFLR